MSGAYRALVGVVRGTALPEVNEAPSRQLTSEWTPVQVSYLSGASSCIMARGVNVAAARPLESDQRNGVQIMGARRLSRGGTL